jgi:hypothetical protein
MKELKICTLVEATCCISNGGKGYDIEKDFNGWVKEWIKKKLSINDNNNI